ncbi:unnamed protein product, partial [marine sediment metagenome]
RLNKILNPERELVKDSFLGSLLDETLGDWRGEL